MVTVQSAAGPITVAPAFASKIVPFIADAVERGFKGRVSCFDYAGHVPRSRHYAGSGCDFAQTGWNRTVRTMYRVGDLARKHGLRDGCSFSDCGHIDDGAPVGGRRYAHKKPRRPHLAQRLELAVLMPPAGFDRPYHGKVNVMTTGVAREMCHRRGAGYADACSWVSARTGVCRIIIAHRLPAQRADVLRHELAHCNGWSH